MVISDKAQELLDSFSLLFNVRIGIYDKQGVEQSAGQSRCLSCQYCRNQRKNPEWDKLCRKEDQRAREKAETSNKMVHYKCHGGLREAVQPLTVKNRVEGFAMIGQFRLSGDTPPKPNDDFNGVTIIQSEKMEPLLSFFDLLINFILNHQMIDGGLITLEYQCRQYIRESLKSKEEIDSLKAASYLGMSRSSLCHKIKEETGKTFSRLIQEERIQRAELMFQSNPDLSIKEVSYLCGIQDPYYFSRIYKKIKGQAPIKDKRAARRQ